MEEQKKKFPWVIVIIGVVVLCLVCAGVTAAIVAGKMYLDRQKAAEIVTPTAWVEALPTADSLMGEATEEVVEPTETEEPTATEEVIATEEPTATAEPEATPTGELPFSDDIELKDQFANNELGWYVDDTAEYIYQIEDGVYRLTFPVPGLYENAYLPTMFDPQRVTFDARNVMDPAEGTFGWNCNVQDSLNYQYFEFTMPEGFIVSQVVDGSFTMVAEPGDTDMYFTETEYLNIGLGETNNFDLTCTLDEMILVINGEEVYRTGLPHRFESQGYSAFFGYVYDWSEEGYAIEIDNVWATESAE